MLTDTLYLLVLFFFEVCELIPSSVVCILCLWLQDERIDVVEMLDTELCLPATVVCGGKFKTSPSW